MSGQTDADDMRAAVSEVINDLAIQSRVLVTVVQNFDHDAAILMGMQSGDTRVDHVAGMLQGRMSNDIEATLRQLASLHDTLQDFLHKI